jgi:hypothetical protein
MSGTGMDEDGAGGEEESIQPMEDDSGAEAGDASGATSARRGRPKKKLKPGDAAAIASKPGGMLLRSSSSGTGSGAGPLPAAPAPVLSGGAGSPPPSPSPPSPAGDAHVHGDDDFPMGGSPATAFFVAGSMSASSLDEGRVPFSNGATSVATASGGTLRLVEGKIGGAPLKVTTSAASRNDARAIANAEESAAQFGRIRKALGAHVAAAGLTDEMKRVAVLSALLGALRTDVTEDYADVARRVSESLNGIPHLGDIAVPYVTNVSRRARNGALAPSMRGKWGRPSVDRAVIGPLLRAFLAERWSSAQLLTLVRDGWKAVKALGHQPASERVLPATVQHVHALFNTHPAAVAVFGQLAVARAARKTRSSAAQQGEIIPEMVVSGLDFQDLAAPANVLLPTPLAGSETTVNVDLTALSFLTNIDIRGELGYSSDEEDGAPASSRQKKKRGRPPAAKSGAAGAGAADGADADVLVLDAAPEGSADGCICGLIARGDAQIDSVFCTMCERWLHASCVGITPEALDALAGDDDDDWGCHKCTRDEAYPAPLAGSPLQLLLDSQAAPASNAGAGAGAGAANAPGVIYYGKDAYAPGTVATSAASVGPRTRLAWIHGDLNSAPSAPPVARSWKQIVGRTATQAIMRSEGYTYSDLEQKVLHDEHEREDVVSNRADVLAKLQEAAPRIIKHFNEGTRELLKQHATGVNFSAEEQAKLGVELREVAGRQEAPYLVLSQDESACHAHRAADMAWTHPDRTTPGISSFATSKGVSVMMAAFICGFGVMELALIRTGRDGQWWKLVYMMEHVERVILHVRRIFPGVEPLIFVDHSSCHGGFAPDALLVSKLNKGDGGTVNKVSNALRDTGWPLNPDSSHNALTKPQRLMRDDGVCFGLLSIVERRCGKIGPDGRAYKDYKVEELRPIVKAFPDFANEKPQIFHVAERLGGARIIFLPLFHCELNAIELFWAELKRVINADLDGKASTLMAVLVRRSAEITLAHHAGFFRRTERYLRAYKVGMDSTLTHRLVHIVTGRGGNGGSHVSHARVGAEPPPAATPLDCDDVVAGGGEPAEPAAHGACCGCKAPAPALEHCPVCLRLCHTACLAAEEGEAEGAGAGAGAGAGVAPAADGQAMCAGCRAHFQRQRSRAVRAAAAEDGEDGAGGPADAAIAVWRLDEAEIGVAWRYFTAGMEDENGLRRLGRVRQEFADFIFNAATAMARPAYVNGPRNLLAAILVEKAVPIVYAHSP